MNLGKINSLGAKYIYLYMYVHMESPALEADSLPSEPSVVYINEHVSHLRHCKYQVIPVERLK